MLLKRITFAHGFLFLSVNFLRVLVGLLSEAATGGVGKAVAKNFAILTGNTYVRVSF